MKDLLSYYEKFLWVTSLVLVMPGILRDNIKF